MTIRTPSLPKDLRLYAVGDIHGRADLLEVLLEKVDDDRKGHRGAARLVFLGDYVDRGLYSRPVVDRLLELEKTEASPPVFLMGNHERMMLSLLRAFDASLLRSWQRFGGRETLLSYGLTPGQLAADPRDIWAGMVEKTPASHRQFLERLAPQAQFGDYFFCHAGVRPGVDLAAQTAQDLMWIRAEFLAHDAPYARMIVHGHTIAPEAELLPHRINIDTGAYATGRLTALGLEGTRQWLIQTG